MSDPQNPAQPPVPPAGHQPPAYQPPPAYPGPQDGYPQGAYPPAAPPYGAAPSYDQGGQQGPVPGKTLGIVAFVVTFFASVIGLILGIVAYVQSKKAGVKNGWALAAIILGAVLTVLGIIAAIVVFALVMPMLSACLELGPGVWELTNGQVITCE